MTTKRYVFVQPDEIRNNPNLDKPMKFYQICTFIHPKKQKYEVRIVKIDGNNEIESSEVIDVPKKTYKYLIRTLRENLYKVYATFSLDYVDLPSCNDIYVARSPMINIDSAYSGFAQLV